VNPDAVAAVAVRDFNHAAEQKVPGQSTHFPRKSHTMPPICWGAADTEGSGSGGALPPGRGAGRGAVEGGLVSGHTTEKEPGRWWRDLKKGRVELSIEKKINGRG